jgi:hypothetical protein
MILALALLAATPQDPAPPPPRPPREKLICKAETKTGSRVNFREVCHTKAEWDMIHREYRQAVERGQQQQNRMDPNESQRPRP